MFDLFGYNLSNNTAGKIILPCWKTEAGEYSGRSFGSEKMKSVILFGFLALLVGVKSAAVETVNADILVDSVDRTIDIASQLVKINTKVTLTNNGKGAITGFHYGMEEAAKAKLAFIGATVRIVKSKICINVEC